MITETVEIEERQCVCVLYCHIAEGNKVSRASSVCLATDRLAREVEAPLVVSTHPPSARQYTAIRSCVCCVLFFF
jgi:hypothetical protein